MKEGVKLYTCELCGNAYPSDQMLWSDEAITPFGGFRHGDCYVCVWTKEFRKAASRLYSRGGFSGPPVTGRHLYAMYLEQRGVCAYCKQPMMDRWSVDHKIPVSRGGTSDPDNLTLACLTCNSRKRTRTPEEWRSTEP